MLRPAVEAFNDPDFGSLRRVGGGDWHGEVPFDHPPTGASSLSLLIGAGDEHPTDEQRVLFREILRRYAELWPRVAEALASYHPEHNTVEAVAKHIDKPCLCLDPLVGGQPCRWSLQYTFDYPNEGDMGYFVDFCEWEIVGVSAVD
jgi:hypothetical protein